MSSPGTRARSSTQPLFTIDTEISKRSRFKMSNRNIRVENVLTIFNSSPTFWKYEVQLVLVSFGELEVLTGIFVYDFHNPLTNQLFRVTSKQSN